jgi:hypothetical protein
MNLICSSSSLGLCLRLVQTWGYDSISFFNFLPWLLAISLDSSPVSKWGLGRNGNWTFQLFMILTWLLDQSLDSRLQAKPLGTARIGIAWECVFFYFIFASSSLCCWLLAYIRGLDAGPWVWILYLHHLLLGWPQPGVMIPFFFSNFLSWLLAISLDASPVSKWGLGRSCNWSF